MSVSNDGRQNHSVGHNQSQSFLSESICRCILSVCRLLTYIMNAWRYNSRLIFHEKHFEPPDHYELRTDAKKRVFVKGGTKRSVHHEV